MALIMGTGAGKGSFVLSKKLSAISYQLSAFLVEVPCKKLATNAKPVRYHSG
jgi:hypothetical protein